MAQGKITISTITHKIVTVDGEEHTLRSKEYQMLCLLLERAPLCVTRREIISHVWSGRTAQMNDQPNNEIHTAQTRR